MDAVTCPLHDAAVLAVEDDDENLLLTYGGPRETAECKDCPDICGTARRFLDQYTAVRHMQDVPEGETPAELWTKLKRIVEPILET